MEKKSLESLPLFIPLKDEVLQEYGVPYKRATIWRHRATNGFLSAYTVKRGSRLFFALKKFFEDTQKEFQKKVKLERG